MKRMEIVLKHFIATGPLILFLFLVISCEKESAIIIVDSEPISDVDGNVYKTIKIGEQVWLAENLNVTHFRIGDLIPEVKTTEEWIQAGIENEPAWCYNNNDPDVGRKYGKLYNWYAVNDPRGLTPENWTIPDNNEWAKMIDYLGGNKEAGAGMKSESGWNSIGNGNNFSRFTALPGGGRIYNGVFSDIDNAGVWWSSVEESALTAYGICLISDVVQGSFKKATGLSVRPLKCNSFPDETTSQQTLAEKLQVALDQMLTFHSPCTGEEFISSGYGLGVCKFNPQLLYGLEAYGHGGHRPGYAAACIYLPDYQVCIGIMDNTDGGECIGSSIAKLIKVIISHLNANYK